MTMNLAQCEPAIPGVSVPLETLMALPRARARSASGDDLARIVVENVLNEHILVALKAETPDEFVRATNEHLQGFLVKVMAFAQLRRSQPPTESPTPVFEGDEWNLAMDYFRRASGVAKRMRDDERFRRHVDGDTLLKYGTAMCVASWFVVCGAVVQAGLATPSDAVHRAIEGCALDASKQAYHHLRDKELEYSAPSKEETERALEALRQHRRAVAA